MKNTTDTPEVLLCMSTGRCGTAYLQKILSSAHFTHSLHEPRPTLASLSTFCDEEIIIPAIVEKVTTMLVCKPPGTTTYAETNHCLLHRHWKYFLITLLARIDPRVRRKVGVVVLRRREEDVVRSRLELGHGTKYMKDGEERFRGEGWIYYPTNVRRETIGQRR
jgi:hypothetical protein